MSDNLRSDIGKFHQEAVTAVENKESVNGEFNKAQALWRTSLMFGYIHSADDFIQACKKLGK